MHLKLELCITLQESSVYMAGKECVVEDSYFPRDWGAEKKRRLWGHSSVVQSLQENWVWWSHLAIPTVMRLKQEDLNLKIILSYIVSSWAPCSMWCFVSKPSLVGYKNGHKVEKKKEVGEDLGGVHTCTHIKFSNIYWNINLQYQETKKSSIFWQISQKSGK